MPLLARRLSDRRFWIVQAGVLAVTATHVLLEALTDDAVARGDLPEGLHHIPVALYALPVAYAGLAYGFEGGVLTGLWSAALVAPSIPIWHLRNFAWVGETIFVAVVIGIGAVLSLPVERERRQRRLAEAAARRLALVHEVTAELARPGDLQARTSAALGRVVDVLPVDGAGLVLWRGGEADPVVATSWPRAGRVPDELEGDGVFVTPVRVEEITGTLAVRPRTPPLPADDQMLVAAVGHQLGVAVDNALLHRDERTRLQSYAEAVTQAQEEERRRIARDLHDDSAQELALLVRGLDDLRERLEDGSEGAAQAAELTEHVRWILENIRRFSRDLRPTVLDDFGLVPALKSLVAQLDARAGLHTRFTAQGTPRRLSPQIEIALFRITQEAVRNAQRHARATSVEVHCQFEAGRVRVHVRDDGGGFEVLPAHQLLASGHLGLVGMRERAQLVGASVTIASAPGQGTNILIEADDRSPSDQAGVRSGSGS